MMLELVPKDLLDNIIKDRCKNIPPYPLIIPLKPDEYMEEFDVFYRNFGEMNQKEYYGENKEKEVNMDIEIINKKSCGEVFKIREGERKKWEEKNKDRAKEEIKEEREKRYKKRYTRCTLMICDNMCFFEDELREHFEDFPTMSFGKLKNYENFPMAKRIGIQLTCTDTRYEPLTVGYIITD